MSIISPVDDDVGRYPYYDYGFVLWSVLGNAQVYKITIHPGFTIHDAIGWYPADDTGL